MLRRCALLLLLVSFILFLPYSASLHAQGDVGNDALFVDDFADNGNDWTLNTRWGALNVGDEALRLTATTRGAAAWATPEMPVELPTDVAATVTVRFSEGLNGQAAILLRVADDGVPPTASFYGFSLSALGEWRLFKRSTDTTASIILQRGNIDDFNRNEPHTLIASAKSNTLSLVVDNMPLATYQDEEQPLSTLPDDQQYNIGLYVNTSNDNIATLEFSDLAVGSYGGTFLPDEVLFADDFSVDVDDWTLGEFDTASARIEDGAMVLTITDEVYYWTLPLIPFPRDISLETLVTVDLSQTQGDWYYGIAVRYAVLEDEEPFYLFTISYNQFWGFWRVELLNGGDWLPIQDWSQFTTFDPYDPHRIKVVAKGDLFQFYVDDELFSELEYETTEQVDDYYVALVAGLFNDSGSESMITIRFDNVEVRAIDPASTE
jgi:hypothetical protein